MCFFFSAEKVGLERMLSRRSCHQRFCAWSLTYMNSAPIEPQYVSRRLLSSSRRLIVSLPKYVLLALKTMS